ncbi:hypothetical protein MASR1M68_12580 [Elusimicrobiota bacterium]
MIYNTQCPICLFKGQMKKVSVVCGTNILLCPNCSVEFLATQISQEEVKRMYDQYYNDLKFDSFLLSNLKKKTFAGYIEKLKFYKATGTLLDVGTQSGFLLDVAQKEGFNVFGVELSEYASRIAKTKFGSDKIHTGTIKTANFNKKYFDLITMCDLLEHVQDPVDTLKSASGLLKEDGCIMIVTPDYNSLISRIVRMARKKYPFEHLYYFNAGTIEKMCKLAGFKIIDKNPVWKMATIEYIYSYLKLYKMFPLSFIFWFFKLMPFIRKINFKMPSGSMMYILKKHGIR